jgi:hypothetical protein
MAVDVAAVRVDGLTAFRRDLKQIDKGLPRELGTVMKGAAERTVLPVARADAPAGPGRWRAR